MNPLVRLFGRVLSLVGIASPADAAARKNAEPPAWKKAAATKAAQSEQKKQA
jgi:hypothetical protein